MCHLILKVYGLKQITEDMTGLFECGFFGRGSSKLILDAYDALLKEMRPHLVPLVELTDDSSYVKSAAGNHHGDIFDQMWGFVRNSKLNRENPIPTYYEKYMKPIIQSNGDGGKFKL